MQTAPALTRVARECVEDLAADGVVYAEIRYAPEQHVSTGLSLDEVVAAVQQGFDEGAAAAGGRIVVRQLLTAMRHRARSMEIAELAVAWRDRGVAGFDIAGAEAGYPPTRHLDAFEYLQRENSHFTIHAGEAFGLPSIWQAIQWCGADRLGHGVRIVDDITVADDGSVELGLLANYVRDKRIPLEMCPTSNLQTGAATSIAEHPIGLLTRLRFRVTVNTDNRLMSQTSMTHEMHQLVEAFGYGLADLRWFTINAMKSAFLPFDERLAIIDDVVKPGYAALMAEACTREPRDGPSCRARRAESRNESRATVTRWPGAGCRSRRHPAPPRREPARRAVAPGRCRRTGAPGVRSPARRRCVRTPSRAASAPAATSTACRSSAPSHGPRPTVGCRARAATGAAALRPPGGCR